MKTEFEPLQAKNVLFRFDKIDNFFSARYSLNPYSGCPVGCRYCYVQEKKHPDSSSLEAEKEKLVKIKIDLPYLLKEKLARHIKPAMIVIGSSCEPYADIEDEYYITRRLLEILADYDFPIHIITRFGRVLRDMDLITEINKRSFACVTVSIPVVSKELVHKLEGDSPTVKERLKTIKLIRKNNIAAGVGIAPVLPYISDGEEINKVLKQASTYRASYALYSPLIIKNYQRDMFFSWLKDKYPHLVDSYSRLYTNGEFPDSEYSEKFSVRFKMKAHDLNVRVELPVEPDYRKMIF